MKKLFIAYQLIQIMLIPATLYAPIIPIERNQAWNKAVADIKIVLDTLPEVQKFLKEHEKEIKLNVRDMDFEKNLDQAIEASGNLNKDLKVLKKEMQR